jgi:hypothetical protein
MKDRALTPDLVFPTNSANPLGTPILHLFVAMVYPALHHTSEPVPTRRRVSNCKKIGNYGNESDCPYLVSNVPSFAIHK